MLRACLFEIILSGAVSFFLSLSLFEEVGGKSWHIVKATSSATDSTIVHSTTECNWGGGVVTSNKGYLSYYIENNTEKMKCHYSLWSTVIKF